MRRDGMVKPLQTNARGVTEPNSIPNGRLVTDIIGLSQDYLLFAGNKSKVAVPAQLLKELLTIAASTLPFEQDFYLATYPDIRKAYAAGRLADPRTHFIEVGYIEGRLGSNPNIDEEYYKRAYPDVAAAIATGALKSALDHYLRAGALEGRCPNSKSVSNARRWAVILGRE